MRYFSPILQTARGHHPSTYLAPATSIIKLNSNENPYAPSPKALAALQTMEGEWLRRYPDPYAQEFCTIAAAILGIPENWLIVGNGCDDLLGLLIRACGNCESTIVYPTPTYGLYSILGELCGAPVQEIAYPPNNHLPIEQLLQAAGALTLIASPNSPSGHQVPLQELRRLAEGVAGILAIDEAYVDFGDHSALELIHDYDHVILLRTLSKGYSLAGLRFGFGIAQPSLLEGLFKLKDSYSVDAIAIYVAAAAIADQSYKDDCIRQIKSDRTHLTESLRQLNFHVSPSYGNFVLAEHNSSQDLHNALREHNIWVRHFQQPGLDNKLRITVGTPEQNQTLLETLARIIEVKI
ncbi:MAG: histidinol-phosphate transaminase [Cyanobacteria bacterium P01_D01_bin.156]